MNLLLSILSVFILINFSFAENYVEGEVIVKLKKSSISTQSLSENLVFKTGLPVKIQKVFQHNKTKILLVKSENMTTEELIKALKKNPFVEKVEPNYLVKIVKTPNDEVYTSSYSTPDEYWGFEKINAFDAWDISTGSNDIVIAVLDTGVDYKHPDLKENIWKNEAECSGTPGVDDDNDGYIDDCLGYDMYDGDNDPMDYDDHGTHISGIIGAVGNNNIGIAGVNWKVKILPCKIFNDDGDTTSIYIILKCLDYMVKLKDRGVNIVASNNSWAGGKGVYLGDQLKDAIQETINKGIMFVTAAGNQEGGYNENNDEMPVYPCNYQLDNDGIICVSATDKNDQLPWFSYYGKNSVDLAAPGDRIYSTVSGNSIQITGNGRYGYMTGTSMATPFVTGAVALIKSAYDNLNWKDIKTTILLNTDKLSSLKDKTFSEGRLNLYKCLANPLKAIDNDLGIEISSTYTINNIKYIDNDFSIENRNYYLLRKPLYIDVSTNLSYVDISLSFISVPTNASVAFCDIKTRTCYKMDENLWNRNGNSFQIRLENNGSFDFDNDTGRIKTAVAFIALETINAQKSGSGGGCSLSKNADFSLILLFVILGLFFVVRKSINKSCKEVI